MVIAIKGLDKAMVLMALYQGAKGSGDPRYLPLADARQLILEHTVLQGGRMYFDALAGRHLHVDLSGDEVDVTKYELWNGRDSASEALRDLFELMVN